MKRLIEIQHKLKAPKGQFNKFGNYKYRSAEDILEAVKPLLYEQGLLLTLTDDAVMLVDRHYIKATATITDGKGLLITNTAYAREDESKKGMDGSQITGTSSSYARKYALNGLFLIDDTKDADTDEWQKTINAATATPKAQPVQPQAKAEDEFPMFAEMLRQAATMKDLQAVWGAMSPQAKNALTTLKDECKAALSN